ncbi:MAG: ABC transporter permease [Bacteroidales bacterium]|nr:ABC transporter permease [Bacteroidales bacterium]
MALIRKKNVSTLINIIGMGVALAAAMILSVQVKWDVTFDRNYEGHENVFILKNNWMDHGDYYPFVCRPVLEKLRDASPNVSDVGIMHPEATEAYSQEEDKGNAVFAETIKADSSYFSIYPFKWIEGSGKDFNSSDAIAICESFARKMFGDESVVGKKIVTRNGETKHIVGVFEDLPENSLLKSEVIKNIGNASIDDPTEWSYMGFLKLKDPSLADDTREAVFKSIMEYFADEIDDENLYRSGMQLCNLHDAHFEPVRIGYDTTNRSIVYTLSAIAFLLILIAIINFINFAFAEIPFSIREINTRKVLGESRYSLVLKQVIHAGVISVVAFGLACLIMHAVSLSSFASYVSGSIKLQDNLVIVFSMLFLSVLIAVLAGLSPALYSTSQPMAMVLKGSFALSIRGRGLRNLLIGLQFVLSFVFIIISLFVGVQVKYMSKKDMGFERASIIQVGVGYYSGRHNDAIKEHLFENPAVMDITFSDAPIVSDIKMGWSRTNDEGNQVYFEVLPIDYNFTDFFGIPVLEGRSFSQADIQSEYGCFIANESFFNKYPSYHIGSLVGAHVDQIEIVGSVRDFNYKNLKQPIAPLLLLCWGKTMWRPFSTMYVKVHPETDFNEISSYIKNTICSIDPSNEPDQIDIQYLDNCIEDDYKSEKSLGKLISVASFVALLIAIIGIVGLVFFETQFIRKEIAVRRVNGATIGGILRMINKKYFLLVCGSFAIAVPLAVNFILYWLKGFAYKAPIPIWIFLLAFVLVALITVLVVTAQSWKTANVNPVESLRNE